MRPKAAPPNVVFGPTVFTVLVTFSTSRRSWPRALPTSLTSLAATKSQLLRCGVRTLSSVRGLFPSVNAAGCENAAPLIHTPGFAPV